MTPAKPDDSDALYSAVGFVVVQWGIAEQLLDGVVAMLYHSFGGRTLAKRLPKQLEVKLKFVRKCVTTNPDLAPFAVKIASVADTFERLSSLRHDLIHGAIASLTAEGGMVFKFQKLDFMDPHMHRLRVVRFDAADFPKLTEDLVDLGSLTGEVAKELIADHERRLPGAAIGA